VVDEARQNDVTFRGDVPGAGLRRTTKKLSSVMDEQQIIELQESERTRAQDMQRRAIEKVLLGKSAKLSKGTKEARKLAASIKNAKETAFTVHEYSNHSQHIFLGHDEYIRRLDQF